MSQEILILEKTSQEILILEKCLKKCLILTSNFVFLPSCTKFNFSETPL
jgi:hypothetical protein